MGNRLYAAKSVVYHGKAISILTCLARLEYMQDLEIARERLSEIGLALCIVRDGDIIFESVSRGISGFVEAVEKLGDEFEGASVADKVAGKAIALLCVCARVKAVYAMTLSKRGKAVFEKYAIHHEWGDLVGSILDIDRAGVCPFEKLAAEIVDPSEAYGRLKALQRSLSAR